MDEKERIRREIKPIVRGFIGDVVRAYGGHARPGKREKGISGDYVIPRLERGLAKFEFEVVAASKVMDQKGLKYICVLEGIDRSPEHNRYFPNRVNSLPTLDLLDYIGVERFLRGNLIARFVDGRCVVSYESAVLNFDDDGGKNYEKRANTIRNTEKRNPSSSALHFFMRSGDLEQTSLQVARLVAAGTPELVDRL